MKHVGMVTPDFPPGARGVGYYAYYLSKQLLDRGHDVTVFTRGPWGGTVEAKSDGIDVFRVRFVPTYPFHLQLHGVFLNRAIDTMRDELDLLHFHNPSVPAISRSLPTVLTAHGTAKMGIQRRAKIGVRAIALSAFEPILVRNERKLLSQVTRVAAVSNATVRDINEYYGVDDVTVLPNGVDTDYFTPAPRDDRMVLYAGALDPLKGLPDLLHAAKRICRAYPDVRFVIAGEGELESRLKALVRDLGIRPHVEFPGYVDRERIRDYYQRATVYVSPSYSEGLPTAILEAMSCGLPVVATDVGGNSELVSNGETGYLVPPREPPALAESIRSLLEKPEERAVFGNRARENVVQNYDWGTVGDRAERLYSEVLRK